jgi:hypothetical protein
MPYLYSPLLAVSDCLPTKQKGTDGQSGTTTKLTTDVTPWLKEIGSWVPTTSKASSARSASIHLGGNDVKPPQSTDLPLDVLSRSYDGSLEGGDWYRWSGYWSSGVARWDEWRTENDTDTREDVEADIASVIENSRVRDVERLDTVKAGDCHQPGAVQRSEGVQIPVDGHLLSTGKEERGEMLLRWLMESSEDSWHPGRAEGALL